MAGRDAKERAGRPAGTAKKRKAIYKKQYELFLKKLEADKHVSEYRKATTRKAVCLLYEGGFRISEILNLTCDDLCEAVATRQIHLRNNTKTKTARDVFLSRRAVAEIERLFADEIEWCGGKYLFPGRGGSYEKASTQSFTEQLNKLLKKYLNGNYTTHSFRAGYITETVKKYNPKMAQAMIGHKSISTTMRYTEILEDEIKDAIEDIRG